MQAWLYQRAPGTEAEVLVLEKTATGVEETSGAELSNFAGDVAIEVGRLLEDTGVRRCRVTVEWEGEY